MSITSTPKCSEETAVVSVPAPRCTAHGGNRFVYEPLSLDRREVRLCTLQPAAESQPLSCSLSIVSLESKPDYETLSYVWGGPSLSNEIIADGRVINITKNLRTALWYLRTPDIPRVIWADGICINQSDLDERSFQVQIMGDIYRQARGVQIWLGKTEDMVSNVKASAKTDFWMNETVKTFTEYLQSEQLLRTLPPLVSPEHATLEPNIPGAIRILELLAAGRHFYQMPFFKVIGGAIGPCPVWLCSMRSLAAILNCPWWTRIWIVQEAMISTRATVHIGEYQAPLSLFLNFRRSIVEHESDCCGTEELQNLWYGRPDISTSLLHAGNRLDELRARDDDRLDGRIILLDALYISSSRQASDPRDHVYALHGVLDYGYGLIKANYELSTEKVFSNATRELFQDTRSLSALGHAIGVEPNNVHELPSWVCDWTRQITPIESSQLYKASNGEMFIAKQTIDRILTVETCKVDMISTTKSPIPCSRLATVTGLIEILEEWRSLVNIKGSDDLFAFWTTVLFGTIKLSGEEIRRILPKDWIIIKTWWEEVQSVRKEGRNYSTAVRRDRDLLNVGVSIRRSAQRYNFWLTSQGFLGVGPRTLKKGDEVFIAKGSNVPLVFRPIENTLAQSFGIPANERGYLFVGPCYLHGFMDGEAVKPDTKWQTVHLC